MSTYFKVKGYKIVTADLNKKETKGSLFSFNAWSQILLSRLGG